MERRRILKSELRIFSAPGNIIDQQGDHQHSEKRVQTNGLNPFSVFFKPLNAQPQTLSFFQNVVGNQFGRLDGVGFHGEAGPEDVVQTVGGQFGDLFTP
jgi:hypothetical protein